MNRNICSEVTWFHIKEYWGILGSLCIRADQYNLLYLSTWSFDEYGSQLSWRLLAGKNLLQFPDLLLLVYQQGLHWLKQLRLTLVDTVQEHLMDGWSNTCPLLKGLCGYKLVTKRIRWDSCLNSDHCYPYFYLSIEIVGTDIV